MMNRKIEFFAGLFVLAGLIAVLYLALQVGSARFFKNDSYQLQARFSSAAGSMPAAASRLRGFALARCAVSSSTRISTRS